MGAEGFCCDLSLAIIGVQRTEIEPPKALKEILTLSIRRRLGGRGRTGTPEPGQPSEGRRVRVPVPGGGEAHDADFSELRQQSREPRSQYLSLA